MQQVMTLTIERLRSRELHDPARVLSFVLGSCRLMVMEQRVVARRRENLLQRYADEAQIAELRMTPSLDHERVALCLDQLVERERSVIVMSCYDDQPADAVGRQLGLSPGNVCVIRHRGLEKLRRCVDAGSSAA